MANAAGSCLASSVFGQSSRACAVAFLAARTVLAATETPQEQFTFAKIDETVLESSRAAEAALARHGIVYQDDALAAYLGEVAKPIPLGRGRVEVPIQQRTVIVPNGPPATMLPSLAPPPVLTLPDPGAPPQPMSATPPAVRQAAAAAVPQAPWTPASLAPLGQAPAPLQEEKRGWNLSKWLK